MYSLCTSESDGNTYHYAFKKILENTRLPLPSSFYQTSLLYRSDIYSTLAQDDVNTAHSFNDPWTGSLMHKGSEALRLEIDCLFIKYVEFIRILYDCTYSCNFVQYYAIHR